jgi:hypothetical protein
MTDPIETVAFVATVEPGRLENYLGYRVDDGAGHLVTLTSVNPTRARIAAMRAELPAGFKDTGDRPEKVRLHTIVDGADQFFRVADEPIKVYRPAVDTRVQPVIFFAGDVRSWSSDDPTGRALILNTIDKINDVRAGRGEDLLTPLTRETVLEDTYEELATQHGSELAADVASAIDRGHIAWVLDINRTTYQEKWVMVDLPGVTTNPVGRVVIGPAPRVHEITPSHYNDTPLAWVTSEDVYSGRVDDLAVHIQNAALTGSAHVSRVYVLKDGELVSRPWSVKSINYDNEHHVGTDAVEVTLPGGVVISATYKWDGRA